MKYLPILDTINKPMYNRKQREKLFAEMQITEQKKKKIWDAFDNKIDALDDAARNAAVSGNTEEEQSINKKIDFFDNKLNEFLEKINKIIDHQCLCCFAAQFPNTKNQWFCNVIENFVNDGKINENFHISLRQYEIFSKYAAHENLADRDRRTYCRVNNQYFISVWRFYNFNKYYDCYMRIDTINI